MYHFFQIATNLITTEQPDGRKLDLSEVIFSSFEYEYKIALNEKNEQVVTKAINCKTHRFLCSKSDLQGMVSRLQSDIDLMK